VREAAYDSATRAFLAHKRTITAAMGTAVKRDVILARLRRYPSALAAALGEVHLPEELFHNLLHVSEAGAVHLRRYNEFRRKELGVEQLQPWDLSAPLDADVDAEITFRDAAGMITKALEPLGSDYRAVLNQAFRERWIDWADNEGKEAGAYSWGCFGYHPVIMMTWQGKIADAFTLAHELGHSVHSVLSARTQPYVYSDYPNFLAEMASTTNELLLARYLLKTTQNRTLRRYVLTRALAAFTSNFWGGSMMAGLQINMHDMVEKGEPLTYESVTEQQVAVSRRWYGDTVEIRPESMGSSWLRVLHHFRNFYSYQYATGISAAAAFSGAILSEGEPAVKRYLGFLSAGSSKHPIDILKDAGLDMTTPAPIEKAVQYFADLVTELERT
jgi:oligoendopeptidase F